MVYAQPTIFPENETHKPFWNFEIQTDHLISPRRLSLIIINNEKKRTCKILNFAVDYRIKLKESEKKYKYLNLVREVRKKLEHENDGDSSCNLISWYSHKRIDARTGGLGKKRTSGDHPNYCIIEINQNTKKSPIDLRRFFIIQIPVKDHLLTLIWKTLNYNDFSGQIKKNSERFEKSKISCTSKQWRRTPSNYMKSN